MCENFFDLKYNVRKFEIGKRSGDKICNQPRQRIIQFLHSLKAETKEVAISILSAISSLFLFSRSSCLRPCSCSSSMHVLCHNFCFALPASIQNAFFAPIFNRLGGTFEDFIIWRRVLPIISLIRKR